MDKTSHLVQINDCYIKQNGTVTRRLEHADLAQIETLSVWHGQYIIILHYEETSIGPLCVTSDKIITSDGNNLVVCEDKLDENSDMHITSKLYIYSSSVSHLFYSGWIIFEHNMGLDVTEWFNNMLVESGHDHWRDLPYDWVDFWINKNAQLISLLNEVFGNSNWHCTTFSAKQNRDNVDLSWHRDWPYDANLNESDTTAIQVLWALTPATKSNGATEIIPGSHTITNFEDVELSSIHLEGSEGTMFVFHAATVHRPGIRAHDDKTPRNILLANFSYKTTPKK